MLESPRTDINFADAASDSDRKFYEIAYTEIPALLRESVSTVDVTESWL